MRKPPFIIVMLLLILLALPIYAIAETITVPEAEVNFKDYSKNYKGPSIYKVDNNKSFTLYFNSKNQVTNKVTDKKIVFTVTDKKYLSFVAENILVQKVIVKGGPSYRVYTFNPAVFSASGLHSPYLDSNKKIPEISHYSLICIKCYKPTPEPTPTEPEPTPTEPEPTPTEPKPTPTEPEPTPTVTEPTVTEPTVTEPTVTEPTVTEPTVTEPTVTEPTVTEPTPTEPESTVTEPTPTEPEPTVTEPTPTEPEPTVTEPTVTEPEPTVTEPTTVPTTTSTEEIPQTGEEGPVLQVVFGVLCLLGAALLLFLRKKEVIRN